MGLYNNVPAALVTEFGLFFGATALNLMGTRAEDRMGKWAVWLTVLATFAMMIPGAIPSWDAAPALLRVLLWPLGAWIDRHRAVRMSDTIRKAAPNLEVTS